MFDLRMSTEELLDFVSGSTRPDLRRTTLHFLLGVSAGSDTSIFQNNDFKLTAKLCLLFRDLDEKSKDIPLILDIFVNLTASPLICQHLLSEICLLSFISFHFQLNSIYSVQVSKIVSNLTVNDEWCESLTEKLDSVAFTKTVVEALNDKNANEAIIYMAYVLRNLTRLEKVREIFSEKDDEGKILLMDLYPVIKFVSDDKKERKRVAIDILRNCCFDSSLHATLFSTEDLLVCLLYPLIGGEEFDDEDNEQLPVDLQYMQENKQRENDTHIRIAILETLYQLCATSEGREYIRGKGTYYILREYHKWEKDSQADLLVGNVIGVLIRTEDEIGIADLKSLTVKDDLEAVD